VNEDQLREENVRLADQLRKGRRGARETSPRARGTSPPARARTATGGGGARFSATARGGRGNGGRGARCDAPARGGRGNTGRRTRCRSPRGDSGAIKRPLPGRQEHVADALARRGRSLIPVCASGSARRTNHAIWLSITSGPRRPVNTRPSSHRRRSDQPRPPPLPWHHGVPDC
jgi:hypothetical protein